MFYRCLDIVLQQLSQRFVSINRTAHLFEAIHPNTLQHAKDDVLYDMAHRICIHYSRDTDSTFPGQLVSFRSCFRENISRQTSVLDLAKLLIVDHPVVSSTFSEVCTAFLLFLTLPVSVASAERSFSKLKLIKTYLRSTMGQDRLCGLAIFSIENERARGLNIPQIIDDFAERKARRMPLK